MRRLVLAVLAAATIVALVQTPAHAGVRAVDCPQGAKIPVGVKALIRCAAPRLHVSTAKALAIAYRESKFHPGVRNPSGACGVYQVMPGTWDGSSGTSASATGWIRSSARMGGRT